MEMDQVKVKEELGPEFVNGEPERPEEPDEPEEVELEITSFRCDLCGSEFETEKGRNIHIGRVHKS